MGILVDRDACNRCGTAHEPLCVRDCPGDLMLIDPQGKASIVDNRECWDCAACVKVCPTQAISLQLPMSLLATGGTLRGRALKQKTIWSIRLKDGQEKAYETPSVGGPPFAPIL